MFGVNFTITRAFYVQIQVVVIWTDGTKEIYLTSELLVIFRSVP